MKKPSAIVVISLLAFTCALAFTGTHGKDFYDEATKVIVVPDGFVMTGYIQYEKEPYFQLLALKIDREGNLLWEREWGTTGDDFGRDVVLDAEGNYLFVGDSDGAAGRKLFLVKTDSNGNVLWRSFYDKRGYYLARSALEVSDGYIVVGETETDKNYYQASVVKFDRSGKKVWEKDFGKKDQDAALDAIEAGDGNILLTGYSWIEGDGYLLLVKLDSEGKKIWERYYGNKGEPFLEGRALVRAEEGCIVAGTSSGPRTEGYLMRVDSFGEVLWERTLEGNNDKFEGILADGETYVALAHYWSLQKDGFSLIRLDGSGEILEREDFKNEQYAHSIASIGDGEFIVSGNARSDDRGFEAFWLTLEF